MHRIFITGFIGIWLSLSGCSGARRESASLAAVTMAVPATAIPLLATATAVLPTITPSYTPQPPPSPTTMPTSTPSPTPTNTNTPEPTWTPSPTPTEDLFACHSLEALANARPSHTLITAGWQRPSASPAVIGVGPDSGLNLIHLGFDVEGSPAHLGELLDVLDRHGVKTTFFILGSWAESYPGWVQEIVNRGHELGNHTYSHANLKPMTAEEVLSEIQRTETTVRQITGQSTRPWLRPPFGSRSETSIQTAYENGWTTVAWTGSADDWREEYTEDLMCRTLRSTAFPGAILYTHTFRSEIPAVIDRFIGEMQLRGFTFVPLSILFSADPGQYLSQ